MKPSLLKIGSLGIALLLLFAFSTGFANDFPDFEKLLQDALRANQNGTAADAKTNGTELTAPRNIAAPSPAKETQPAPSPETPARTMATQPMAPNAKAASPTTVISDGWTTVEPNAPDTVVPEQSVILPPPAKLPAHEIPNYFPFAPAEPDELTEPKELVEPDPIQIERRQSPAANVPSQPLFFDTMFDVEYIVIGEEEGAGILSEPETQQSNDNATDPGTITEPRRIRDEPKEDFPVAPAEQGELGSILDNFAHERFALEPKKPALNESASEPAAESEQPVVLDKTQVTVVMPDFDSDEDETHRKMIDASLVGDAYAVDKLKLMYDEITNGLRTRNVANRYEMWKGFAKGIMRDTAGINTRSELDGRWRLPWFLKLYEEPVRSVFTAEEYSRELYVGLSGNHRHLAELMSGIRERMDVARREDAGIKFPLCTTPKEALAEVKRALLIAANAHSRAFSTLESTDIKELETNLFNTFVGNTSASTGHTVHARSVARKHADIFTKVDMAAMYDGAEALIPITNTALLDLLVQLPDDALPHVMVNGQRMQRLSTAAGDIIIGGRGKNMYDLDSPEMRDVICVISFGEDDSFREGTCDMNRPVLLILALGKKNTFVGTKPGIQGGSIMGISMLLDRGGNSIYSASDVAQGSTMGGVGILINYDGGNKYTARRRAQGHALLGLGMLIDRGPGNASYKAALWAQGFGAPGGFGILSNSGNGNNHYYCGGLYLDSYPEHPGYDGWGQGVGAGIRQAANGGIGIILSGAGDDVYEVDYFGHGGGYWLGVGIARDFGGSDVRHGTTLTTYDGRPRTGGNGTQTKWTRFANGWGCHYALGYLFDDAGNDVYGGQIMGTGMAWDLAFGILCDFSGSGKYTSTGNMKHGHGAQAGIGILFSYGGDGDFFAGRSQGVASASHDYHPAASGGNFSFLINYGGDNQYGAGNQKVAQKHSYVQRGTASGFLIDRPTESEAATAIVALRQAIENRNREIAEYDAKVDEARQLATERKQRYIPPRGLGQRPRPIQESQLISAVPDFSATKQAGTTETRTSTAETSVK